MLEPVEILYRAGWWEIVDVAEERYAFWARWERQLAFCTVDEESFKEIEYYEDEGRLK